jgi:DNA end-binding protein Ku
MAASVWRGRVTFGLVSIPVRLVKAARRERARFRRVQRVSDSPALHSDSAYAAPVSGGPRVLEFPPSAQKLPPSMDSQEDLPEEQDAVVRVRNAPVNSMTETPVRSGEILKGYEIAKDEFVVLAPKEVAALRPQTSSELEITDFVQLAEVDPLYYEASYYVIPEAGGEAAYALLFATLKETGHAGMGSLAMHGREHVVLIRAGSAGLVLHSMFFANEIGRPGYQVEVAGTNAKQLELAKMLVGALEAKFEPEKWKDRYEEGLKALIESRAPVPSAAAAHPGVTSAAGAADIMEALRKSLERLRKPAGSAGPLPKPKRLPAKRK